MFRFSTLRNTATNPAIVRNRVWLGLQKNSWSHCEVFRRIVGKISRNPLRRSTGAQSLQPSFCRRSFHQWLPPLRSAPVSFSLSALICFFGGPLHRSLLHSLIYYLNFSRISKTPMGIARTRSEVKH